MWVETRHQYGISELVSLATVHVINGGFSLSCVKWWQNIWKVTRKRKSWTSLNFYVHSRLSHIASIWFTHINFTGVRTRTEKLRDTGNQPHNPTRIAERRFLTGLQRGYFFWGEGVAIYTLRLLQNLVADHCMRQNLMWDWNINSFRTLCPFERLS